MQQLLTGKRRFASTRSVEWKLTALHEVFDKVRAPVDVDPELDYKEIGIRSHGKGIFHKEPVSGKALGTSTSSGLTPVA